MLPEREKPQGRWNHANFDPVGMWEAPQGKRSEGGKANMALNEMNDVMFCFKPRLRFGMVLVGRVLLWAGASSIRA